MKAKMSIIVSLLLSLAMSIFLPVTLNAWELFVTVNGRTVGFDGQGPVVIQGHTLVPVRGVFEALGFDVGWDGVTQTATLTGRGYVVNIAVGHDSFMLNGKVIELGATPAQIIGGRIMLPLRTVLESMGFTVEWDPENVLVHVRDPLFAEPPQSIDPGQIRGTATTITTGNSGMTWSPHGINANYVIRSDGSLWVWGGVTQGWLAGESTIVWYEPVRIMENTIKVAGNFDGALVIGDDNSLWQISTTSMWQDHTGSSLYFRTEKIMDDIVYVSAGNSYAMAIDSGGVLWGWGANYSGQLGDGTTMNWENPVRIMEDVVSVAAARTGWGRTFAVRTDGSLWAWGGNATDAFGDGTVTEGPSHVPIRVMENIAVVSATHETVMAITTSGELWAWGWNYAGQIGNGEAAATPSVAPMPIMDGVIAVSTGTLHTMAIRFDGTLWAWGSNAYGQLGDGTTSNRHTPIMVLDNVVDVSAGSTHTIALRTDGSLWAWGSNEEGQLGDGEIVNSRVPIRIFDGVRIP